MNLRDKAVGGTAVVEFCIRTIEAELKDARREAVDGGLPAGVVEAVDEAQRAARRAHRKLDDLRSMLASAVGGPITLRSGPEEKPEIDPEAP